MSKVRTLAAMGFLIGLVGVVIITYNVGFSDIIDSIIGASPVFIACYLVTSILIAAVLTFKWKLILHTYDADIPFHRLFSYRLVGYSVSYLTPTAHVGGEPIRAFLLKREGVHINTAFSSVIIDKSIEVMTDVLFFFFGALLLLNSVGVSESMKILILSISLLLILLMGMFVGGVLGKRSMFVAVFRFLRLNKIRRLRNIERNLAQIEKQIERFYRDERKYFLAIIALMIVLWSLMFLEYRFALLIFGHIASPLQVFLILTGVGLAYTIPIPAALGVLELGQLSAAKVLNLSAATSIALAFLVRTRDLIWTGIGMVLIGVYQFDYQKLSQQSKDIDKDFEKGDLFRKRGR